MEAINSIIFNSSHQRLTAFDPDEANVSECEAEGHSPIPALPTSESGELELEVVVSTPGDPGPGPCPFDLYAALLPTTRASPSLVVPNRVRVLHSMYSTP